MKVGLAHELRRLAGQSAACDQTLRKANQAQFMPQRSVHRNLVETVNDCRGGPQGLVAIERIDLNDDNILAVAFLDQWEEGRIPHITAIPIGFAVNLDRLKD